MGKGYLVINLPVDPELSNIYRKALNEVKISKVEIVNPSNIIFECESDRFDDFKGIRTYDIIATKRRVTQIEIDFR